MESRRNSINTRNFVIVTLAIACLEAMFFYLSAGLKGWTQALTFAPIVLVTMNGGLDLCRYACICIGKKLPANFSQVATPIVLTICLVVLPIPLTIVLKVMAGLLPFHIQSMSNLFECWRLASGMSIIHGIIALCQYPATFRSLYCLGREAFEIDACGSRVVKC